MQKIPGVAIDSALSYLSLADYFFYAFLTLISLEGRRNVSFRHSGRLCAQQNASQKDIMSHEKRIVK